MPAEFQFVGLHLVGVEELRRRWRSILALGIALVLLGMAAIAMAMYLTLATMLLLGILLIVVGVVQGLHAFANRGWGGSFLDLVSGVLYAVIGFLIVGNPGASAEALTLVVAVFLIFGGIFRIVVSFMIRFHNALWLLLHGAIKLALGILIWKQWPWSGQILIGLFVGIEMIFNGWSLIMLGLAAKKLKAG